jgi:hypothetical protein
MSCSLSLSIQTDRWSLICNTARPGLHQKNGNAKQVLQHKEREVTVKKELLKRKNVKISEIKPVLPQVLRPDTGFCMQVPP